MSKSQRDKGGRGEREFSAKLNEGGIKSRRGNVFYREEDVVTDEPIHFEVKRQENTKVWAWYEQAIEQSRGKVPVVGFRRNRGEWMILLSLEDFLWLRNYWKGEEDDDRK